MVRHLYSPQVAKEHYLRFGDERPPLDTLARVVASLDLNEDAHPDDRLVLADASLDMFVVTKKDEHLKKAASSLGKIIGIATVVYRQGQPDEWPNLAPFAARAHLRRAELPHWEQAVKGQVITPSYSGLLGAARNADRLREPIGAAHSVNVQAFVAEFLIIVLGVRAHIRAEERKEAGLSIFAMGWLARNALRREDDRRGTDVTEENPNWDLGATDEEQTTASFISPTVRGQVTLSRKTKAKQRAYERAGIPVISATDCGFSDTRLVIDSCLAEMDQSTKSKRGPTLLNTRDLDRITRLTEESIFA